MIGSTLKYLASEISKVHHDLELKKDNLVLDTNAEFVSIGNIAKLDNSADSTDSIQLTLVNIEEEKTLKNGAIYELKNGAKGKKNPTIYINLYILFSYVDNKDYYTTLNKISGIIEAVQAKQVFTPENTLSNAPFPENVEKIILDLFTLNFEQINHLWGILGGKYQPSVMYKARLIAIQASNLGPVTTIEEIATNN